MKRHFILLLLMAVGLWLHAQERAKFSPEEFEAKLEAYVTREAGLTPQEAAKFFPLLREMHQKQRTIYNRMRQSAKEKPATEKAAAELIHQCDKWQIELKQIEQKYHDKMLKELPATKVYQAINAENNFHRKVMKGWQRNQVPKSRPRDKRH